jgi:hypothetical protein
MPHCPARRRAAGSGVEVRFEPLGKPHLPMVEAAARRFSERTRAENTVGDQLDTEILAANRFGIESVLVKIGIDRWTGPCTDSPSNDDFGSRHARLAAGKAADLKNDEELSVKLTDMLIGAVVLTTGGTAYPCLTRAGVERDHTRVRVTPAAGPPNGWITTSGQCRKGTP